MDILFSRQLSCKPKVSFILIDWSCRESYHLFHYLNRQTVPRDQYEIIWIEYYNREAPGIRQELSKWEQSGGPPPLDQWILMNMPTAVYYHKHLMYNVGIVLCRGDIVAICDPDAIVNPSFVENIITTLENDPNTVLHMDEVRNNDQKFYPFNYPSIAEVVGPGAANYKDGKTTGLLDQVDPLHSRNYGACLCAWKRDLVAIGGADEHVHYIGASASPYEITFRLGHFGKREFWHETEILYHVWHPGQGVNNNVVGPHDGKHMSLTALKIRETGRIEPLVKNQAVSLLQTGAPASSEQLAAKVIDRSCLDGWTHEALLTHPDFCLSYNPELLGSDEGYNIVRYKGRYYGVSKSLGTVDFENKAKVTELEKAKELFSGSTQEEVLELVWHLGRAVEPVESGYQGYNILRFRRKYYAMSQALGDLNLANTDEERLKKCLSAGEIHLGESLTEVKQWIEQCGRMVETVEVGYQGFNILRIRKKFYAVLQALGDVDLADIKKEHFEDYRAAHKIYVAESLPEIKSWIDRQGCGLVKMRAGFNCFRFKEKYFVLSQALGDLDLRHIEESRLRELVKAREIFIGDTLSDVDCWLDSYERIIDKAIRKIKHKAREMFFQTPS